VRSAKAACRATVDTLEGEDLIEVVAFDSTPIRYVKMEPARYRTRIEGEIARIQPGGGTEINSALLMAYQDMTAIQARRKLRRFKQLMETGEVTSNASPSARASESPAEPHS